MTMKQSTCSYVSRGGDTEVEERFCSIKWLKNFRVKKHHVTISAWSFTLSLLITLLIQGAKHSQIKEDKTLQENRYFISNETYAKPCSLIDHCLIIGKSNTSEKVFLFHHELTFLSDILWRCKMPSCSVGTCKVNLENSKCHYQFTFSIVSVCFTSMKKVDHVILCSLRSDVQLFIDGKDITNVFKKLLQ